MMNRMSSLGWRTGMAIALGALAGGAWAQVAMPQRTPEVEKAIASAHGLSAAFNYASKRIAPSVVHVSPMARVRRQMNWFEPPKTQLLEIGAGSGVVVSEDGYILTNNHVVSGAERVKVKFADGRELDGKIVGTDPATDLGVVKVEASGLTAATWGDADALEVGEWVLAVGSPFGEYDNSVTAGIVSAKNRTNLKAVSSEQFEDFIQTDAAINPGNSGGPLVDIEGRVVGINSQIATRGVAQSAGIGFSIPSTIARPVMESIVKTGRAQRGWLGIAPQYDGAPRGDGGVAIARVEQGSPAERAGIKPGDVVTKVAGRSVDSWNRLRNAIAFMPPGASAEIEVVRGGKPRTLTAQVIDRVDAITQSEGGRAYKKFGFAVETLTKERLASLGYEGDGEGVVVTQIDALGPAAQGQVPLRPGDIIVQIDRTPTPDAAAFDKVIDGLRRDTIRLGVIRGEQRGFIDLTAR